MKKQKQISNWLKGLCVLMAIMGLGLFSFLTGIKFLFAEFYDGNVGLYYAHTGFTWIIAVLCYAVLYQFWKVCGEIGNDNSFSLENAASFHKMAVYGFVAAGCYLIRTGVCVAFRLHYLYICYSVVMMILAMMFVIVCEALSQLIKNAYEVKLENDLTI